MNYNLQEGIDNDTCRCFFDRLKQTKTSILITDYDGTLAPFRIQRMHAFPYGGLIKRLNLLSKTKTKIIIISGRPITEVLTLLQNKFPADIWGCHGYEKFENGQIIRFPLEPIIESSLEQAFQVLKNEGLDKHIELKIGAVLIHWRGLKPHKIAELNEFALKLFNSLFIKDKLTVKYFDGGIELRAISRNKGTVLKEIYTTINHNTPVAYLGDDLTDEDAFAILKPEDLPVLVRKEFRPTHAKVWLKPPQSLYRFLDIWLKTIKLL